MPMLFGVAAPTDGEIVINLLAVLSAADRAFGPCLTGGRTVAASLLNSGAPLTLADAAVSTLGGIRPLAPDVAELAVFIAAFLADFSRGASHCAVIAASVIG